MEVFFTGESTSAETMGVTGILLVDDDIDCLQLLEEYLTMEGFKVTCASNGYEALNLLKTDSFAIMLTDYNMPGIDGLRLSEKARMSDPKMIIIMLTGAPLNQILADANKLGIAAVLAKPYQLAELLDLIQRTRRELEGEYRLLGDCYY